MAAGPVGFRESSDSTSPIKGGAESLLAPGEVRPFTPGFPSEVVPGTGLWVDPHAAPAGPDTPFGLDDACGDHDATSADLWVDPHEEAAEDSPFGLDGVPPEESGDFTASPEALDLPPDLDIPNFISMGRVVGLIGALASKVSLTAFNTLKAAFEAHIADAEVGGVTMQQVNDAITAALVTVLADITAAQGDITTLQSDSAIMQTAITNMLASLSTLSDTVEGQGNSITDLETQVAFNTATGGTLSSQVATLTSSVDGVLNDLDVQGGNIAQLQTDLGTTIDVLNGKQDYSAELSVLAGLTSTPTGRSILTAANVAAVLLLLGLDLVDNTSDANKPVSGPQLAAINTAIGTALSSYATSADLGAEHAFGISADIDVANAAATDATTKSNAASAFAVQRANHTGTQSADTLTDGTTNKAFLATERTKLAGVASGATANATDAQLRDRSTHTGTQPLSTISDAGDAASRNVGTTSTTVAAGDAPAAAQAAAIATAAADATSKANTAVATAASKLNALTNGMPRVSGDTVRAFMIPGVIPVNGPSTVTPSTNRTVFQPIRLDRQRSFDQIQIEVTAAAVSGSRCRTAIYAVDDYWQATNLVFDSGQMANDAIAVVTAGISLTLPAGNYMMETVSQGSATFRVMNCLPPWLNAFKAAAGVSGWLNVYTTGVNSNVANGFPAVSDSTTKFEGANGTTAPTMAYYARFREAA